MERLKVKLLSKDAQVPKKVHASDAAFDLIAPRDVIIKKGRNKVDLEIAVEVPPYHQGMIEARSGHSIRGIYTFADGNDFYADADVIAGKIDSGYRGSLGVTIISREEEPWTLYKGIKVAQLTISEIAHIDECEVVESLSDGDRGNNGFGSTGV